MRILVTGSSGYLGAGLVPRLRGLGHEVVGLDPVASTTTDVVGTVFDGALVRRLLRERAIQAVIHGGALHKPQVATHPASAFVEVNVQGTLNLLEAAVAPGSSVDRFVFTSTTSLMISRELSAGRAAGRDRAAWITESFGPLAPRNIYGISKLCAEQLCRMIHHAHGLPLLILRTSRFFPEQDDMAHAIVQSEPNTKTNELLFRRLSREDAVECHLLALDKAPEIGFDTFIVSARTPFVESDCEELMRDAPAVVARYYPHFQDVYRPLGWTMFDSIDRVYVSAHAEQRLGFSPRTSFASALEGLSRRQSCQAAQPAP